MNRQNHNLPVTDILNAYRNSIRTSRSVLVTPRTPTEAAIVAEIERLRQQNNAELIRLVQNGILSLSTLENVGIIDLAQNGATDSLSNRSGQNIADYLSRRNLNRESP